MAPFLESAYGFTDKYQLLQLDLRDARPHLHRAVHPQCNKLTKLVGRTSTVASIVNVDRRR